MSMLGAGVIVDKQSAKANPVKVDSKRIKAADAEILKGIKCSILEQDQEALKHFKAAIELNPNSDKAYVEQSITLRLLGRSDEAALASQSALAINKDNLLAKYSLPRITDKLMTSPEAISARKIISEATPQTPDDYIAQGYVYSLMGRDDLKLAKYKEAVAAFPKDAVMHYYLGYELKEARDASSKESFQKATKLDPNFFSAWFHLGDVLSLLQDWKGSEKAFKEAHKINPNNIDAFLSLFDVLYQQGKHKESLVLTQQELGIYPEAASVHNCLGSALLELGNMDIAAKKTKAAIVKFNDAEVAFERALEISPDKVLYHCNYARLLHALGRDKESVAEFNKAHYLYQTHKDDQGLDSGNHAFLEQVFATERAPLLEKMTALAQVDLAPIELVGDATKASKKAPDTIDTRWSKQIADKNAEAAHKAQEKQSLMDDAVAVFGQKSAYAADHHAGAAGAASPSLVEMMQHMEKMMASVSALRHELDDMRALQTARQDIAKDHAANEYYHGFVGKLSETFTTSQAVKSGALSLDTDSIVASAVSGALSFLPGGGVAGKLVEAGAKLAKKMDITSKARKFSDVAANHTEFDQIVMHLATEAILAPKMHARIHDHKAEATVTSWFEGIIVSAKKLAAKFDEKMFGKQFATAEAKMGYHDASYLIDLITSDDFTITHNHAELHQKLTTAMLGEEGHHALFEF